jgi:hypothetical protein
MLENPGTTFPFKCLEVADIGIEADTPSIIPLSLRLPRDNNALYWMFESSSSLQFVALRRLTLRQCCATNFTVEWLRLDLERLRISFNSRPFDLNCNPVTILRTKFPHMSVFSCDFQGEEFTWWFSCTAVKRSVFSKNWIAGKT